MFSYFTIEAKLRSFGIISVIGSWTRCSHSTMDALNNSEAAQFTICESLCKMHCEASWQPISGSMKGRTDDMNIKSEVIRKGGSEVTFLVCSTSTLTMPSSIIGPMFELVAFKNFVMRKIRPSKSIWLTVGANKKS